MKFPITVLVFAACWLAPFSSAHAYGPHGEVSVMASYGRTDFGNNSYSTTRRYTATVGVNVTSVTEIELSYGYTDNFFNDDPFQTTSVNEQTLGLSLVQALLPKEWVVQPYVKAGAAQYNRRQSGTTAGIPSPTVESKSPSGVLGGGVRIFLLRDFSLKAEAVTYLPDFRISGAKQNFSVQLGVGWDF